MKKGSKKVVLRQRKPTGSEILAKWREYEAGKAELRGLFLSPAVYEREVAKLARRLGL